MTTYLLVELLEPVPGDNPTVLVALATVHLLIADTVTDLAVAVHGARLHGLELVARDLVAEARTLHEEAGDGTTP